MAERNSSSMLLYIAASKVQQYSVFLPYRLGLEIRKNSNRSAVKLFSGPDATLAGPVEFYKARSYSFQWAI